MILVIGEALIDLIENRYQAGAFNAVVGGANANVALALARRGTKHQFLGRISNDRFGKIIRDRLESNGVNLEHSISANELTTLAVVSIDSHGVPNYSFYVNGTADWGWTPAELPTYVDLENMHATAIQFGCLTMAMAPGNAVIEEWAKAHYDQKSLTISHDINMRPALGFEREVERLDCTRQHAREAEVAIQPSRRHQLTRRPGLSLAQRRQVHVPPAGEPVLEIPGRLAVAEQDESGHRYAPRPPEEARAHAPVALPAWKPSALSLIWAPPLLCSPLDPVPEHRDERGQIGGFLPRLARRGSCDHLVGEIELEDDPGVEPKRIKVGVPHRAVDRIEGEGGGQPAADKRGGVSAVSIDLVPCPDLRFECDAEVRHRPKCVDDMEEMGEGLCEVLPRMGCGVGTDMAVGPIGERAASIVAMYRLRIIGALVPEQRSEAILHVGPGNEPIPIIVADLMTEVTEKGPIRLPHFVSDALARHVIRFDHVQGDHPVGMPGEELRHVAVLRGRVVEEVEGETVRPLSFGLER